MASLFKPTGRDWYVAEFYAKNRSPQRKRVTLKINNRRKAEQKLRQLEDDYALGRFDPWRGDDPLTYDKVEPNDHLRTVGKAVQAFLQAKAHHTWKTVRNYRGVLEPFAAFVGEQFPTVQVTAQHVRAWLDSTETNAVSKATYRRQLRTFFRFLVGEGAIEGDVTEEIRLQRAPDKFSSKLITPEQLQRVVEVARSSSVPYVADAAIIAYELALRLGEVCAMRRNWVDLERRRLIIRQSDEFQTKTGAENVKPISDAACEILTRLLPACTRDDDYVLRNTRGGRLRRSHTSKAFKRIVRAAGLPESITFHSARHGGISKALANGASVEAARRFAGHTTIAMTMRYTHLLEDQYASQVLSAMNA